MEDYFVEEITLALVREYLHGKGLLHIIAFLDDAIPRTPKSVTKRTLLIRYLHMEKLMKYNKEQTKPLSTILEVLVKYVSEKSEGLSKSERYRHAKAAPRSEDLVQSTMAQYVESHSEKQPFNVDKEHRSTERQLESASSVSYGDVVLDDVEDLEISDYHLPTLQKINFNRPVPVEGTEISHTKAKKLRSLLFGSQTINFNSEWQMQNFSFSTNPSLNYGLVQKKGGPCGIMASLQSYIIQELLFPSNRKPIGLNPSEEQQNQVLVSAISYILWQAGQKQNAVLAVFKSSDVLKCLSNYNLKKAGVPLECLMLIHCPSYEKLEACVRSHLPTFKTENGFGCIAFLCSAILSRGIENIRSEMDEPNGLLLGAHGYCTQEIVNLLLTGHAVSNVFDGTVELESGEDKTVLTGINKQSTIGFLSLFEHYRSCEVGNYYKNPSLPIWVVCSESHFSVFFSVDFEDSGSESFHLYYYDGLAKQESEIKLKIGISERVFLSDDEHTPPLEQCIRTKWPNATVTWCDCDPIL